MAANEARVVARDLQLLVSGNAVSALGNAVYLIAVTLLLKDLTQSPVVLGLFQFLALSPGFLLSPVTGALIDRVPRRALIVHADLWRGVVMIGAGAALAVPAWRTAWLILPVSLLAGVGHALFVPAAQALLPSIVPAERLQRATALRASSSQVSNLAGNAAGGFLYALLGAPILFVINGISFLASALFERRIKASEPQGDADHEPILPAARAGLRHLTSDRRLLWMTVSQAGLFALSPFLMLALPFIVIDELGLPEAAVGLYFAAALAGGVALFVGVRPLKSTRLLRVPLVRLGYVALGVAFLLAALVPGPVLIALVALLAGAAASGVYLSVTTWIQLQTPAQMHGRLFALLEAGSAGVAPVSYLVAGGVLEGTGPGSRWIVFLGLSGLAFVWSFSGRKRRRGTTNAPKTI